LGSGTLLHKNKRSS